jgi:deoxyhypusine monooxygenase
VLGQLSHEASVPALTKVLENCDEHPMVRHEAAEALGSIATGDCLPVLEKFLHDKDVCSRNVCRIFL